MARKFKSTITDWVAVEDVSGFNNFTGKFKLYNAKDDWEGYISSRMIVDSSDWQEITERWEIFESTKIGRLVDIDKDGTIECRDCYDFDTGVVIGQLKASVNRLERKASLSEIEQALDAIRKHKGLVAGATAKAIPGDPRTNFEVAGNVSYFGSYDGADRLIDDNGILYDNGVWAELDTDKDYVFITEDGKQVYMKSDCILYEVTENHKILPIESDDRSENPVFFWYRNARDYVEIQQALNATRKHKGLVEGATAKAIPSDSRTQLLSIVSALQSYELNNSDSIASLDYKQGVRDAVSRAINLIQNLANQKS